MLVNVKGAYCTMCMHGYSAERFALQCFHYEKYIEDVCTIINTIMPFSLATYSSAEQLAFPMHGTLNQRA